MVAGHSWRRHPLYRDLCRVVCIYETERKKAGDPMSGLSLSAIVMLIFGAVVCYGGVAYFLYRAMKAKRK